MSLVRRVLGKAKRAARNMLGESPNESTGPPSESPAVSRLAPQSHPAFDVDHEKPLVTVVVPCFNNARFVGDTLRSVSEQSLTNFECIVVDDASTDESARVIAEATAGDERFKVVRHKANAGLSAARNTGLRNALAATITFLDSDDLLMVDSLLDRYVRLEQSWSDPYVAGSFSGISYDGEDVTFDDFPRHKRWSNESPDKHLVDFITAQGECPFPAHAPLLKTELVLSMGGFDENLRTGAEDWDLWLRLMRNGYVFVPAEHRTVVYRQRKDSMVRRMAADHARVAAILIDQAYAEADPVLFVNPTDAPFVEGLAFYEAEVAKTRRIIRFAAIASACGRSQEANALISELPDLPGAVVSRHIDVHAEFIRGAKRSVGLSGSDVESIRELTDSLWPKFEQSIERAFR